MNERIKEIRLKLGLTQEQFGARIGITKSSVSTMESGKSNPSDQTVLFICREYHINETWLRTGEGTPFQPASVEEELEELLRTRFLNRSPEFRQDLFRALRHFDPNGPEWQVIENIVHSFVSVIPADPENDEEPRET